MTTPTHPGSEMKRLARALRQQETPSEMRLWEALRRHQLGGLSFRRQAPVGPYILDFYCAKLRLGLEIDGAVHQEPEQRLHDQARSAYLLDRGILMLHFSPDLVMHHLPALLRFLGRRARQREALLRQQRASPGSTDDRLTSDSGSPLHSC